MKSSPADDPSWDGTNTSGFSGLGGGLRDHIGSFDDGGSGGFFWSASADGTNAVFRLLYGGVTQVVGSSVTPRAGFSVRCVRD